MYVPTLSLTNSICFHHLKDAQKEFGMVRLWGTIGWIAASWPFVFLLKGEEGPALESALTCDLLGRGRRLDRPGRLLADPAPHAALGDGREERALRGDQAPGGAAHRGALPRDLPGLRSCTPATSSGPSPFLAAIGMPENWIMPAMSIGQIAEIGTMAVLGFFLKRLGWRRIMTFGHPGPRGPLLRSTRSASPVWLVIASNVVHGFCYAFFFASVYIFVDEYFPKDARASAQGLFNLLILGLGPFFGSLLWGNLGDALTTAAGVDFHALPLARRPRRRRGDRAVLRLPPEGRAFARQSLTRATHEGGRTILTDDRPLLRDGEQHEAQREGGERGEDLVHGRAFLGQVEAEGEGRHASRRGRDEGPARGAGPGQRARPR